MSMSRVDRESVAVLVAGPVSQPERDYAVEEVSALTRLCREPILRIRVSLDAGGGAGAVPASVTASLDVNGGAVRARAEGTTLREATDLLQARLRTRLVRQEHRPHRGASDRTDPSCQPARERGDRDPAADLATE
ncbi:HPF/RaiA family ribosome-associated protein [Pseudofrankia asymbiotica]|nr:HPF/RaiA family ribosome-associated protein [Pseudofrankia asymbiotica]